MVAKITMFDNTLAARLVGGAANLGRDAVTSIKAIAASKGSNAKAEKSCAKASTEPIPAAQGPLFPTASSSVYSTEPTVAHFEQKRVIQENECTEQLGYSFSTSRKWSILVVGALVQISMNFNTSLYGSGAAGMSQEFGLTGNTAAWGSAAFLVAYAFGCELFAPWSEEYGRTVVLQLSLLLVNCWAIGVGCSTNFASVVVFRALGGLSTAGGSVTLGMVADMWHPENQAWAVAFISWASVMGSVIGPIVGGFMQQYMGAPDWRFTAWVQVFLGVFVQLVHFVLVPETRATVILDRVAAERRRAAVKSGEAAHPDLLLLGPNDLLTWRERCSIKEMVLTFWRPFRMLATERIVLVLSLLSGFSDGLIFMCFESFRVVYGQWALTPSQIGLIFISVGLGYTFGYLAMVPAIKRNRRQRLQAATNNVTSDRAMYEGRMDMLLITAPLLPIGLAIFAATTGGPSSGVHFMVSVFAALLIGIANYAIYYCTIDYMVAAYGVYSASATGGNGFARDLIAGILTPLAHPFYTSMGNSDAQAIQLPSGILAGVALVLCVAAFMVWKYGPYLRARSKFSQQTEQIGGMEGQGNKEGEAVGVAAPVTGTQA